MSGTGTGISVIAVLVGGRCQAAMLWCVVISPVPTSGIQGLPGRETRSSGSWVVVLNVPKALQPRIASKNRLQETHTHSTTRTIHRYRQLCSGKETIPSDHVGSAATGRCIRPCQNEVAVQNNLPPVLKWLAFDEANKAGVCLGCQSTDPLCRSTDQGNTCRKGERSSGFTSGLFQQETELDNPLGQKQPSPFQRPFPKLWI